MYAEAAKGFTFKQRAYHYECLQLARERREMRLNDIHGQWLRRVKENLIFIGTAAMSSMHNERIPQPVLVWGAWLIMQCFWDVIDGFKRTSRTFTVSLMTNFITLKYKIKSVASSAADAGGKIDLFNK